MRVLAFLVCLLSVLSFPVSSQPAWQAALDSRIQFYQTTDFGIVLAGTEENLYALDGQTGERIWRRETGPINETAITPVPDTDLILFSRELGNRSRLEAIDLMSGAIVWQSEKVKGNVLQLAIDPEADLLAVVLVKNPQGTAGSELNRKPIVHVLRLSDGKELWKKELDGEIEMMPSRFGDGGEIAFTFDNYRAPLMIDGRLFLFYDGATSYDARTGKEKEREKFRINEEGLALTESDPVVDASRIYLSGRGRIRAVNRRTGHVEWKAADIGNAAEMALVGPTLFVRTGGQFTRLKDGEQEAQGPYGVAAIDAESGEVKWRYKGADKGLTNFVFFDENTVVFADRDDVITLDAADGRKRDSFEHGVEQAQFVLMNEGGRIVVGGRDELAAFSLRTEPRRVARLSDSTTDINVPVFFTLEDRFAEKNREVWRVRHKPPGRGAFRIIAGIALRATALYFRYAGFATSAFGIARGGLNLASAANTFRWSGLRSRFGSFDLTTLASNAARDHATRRIYSFGSLARSTNAVRSISGMQVITPAGVRGSIVRRITPSGSAVRESIMDRLDPARYAERLSEYLLRRKRLAELRGSHMYFYTDLNDPFDRKGLVGVNIHTGKDARFVLASDPDPQFVTDDAVNLLYSADGDKLQAFNILGR